MDHLDSIEKCLKKFDYPNVYGLQIDEILIASNRNFLLTWLYKLIQDEDTPNLTNNSLTDFLCAYGFCKSSETKSFIEGNMEYQEELRILSKMFKLAESVRKEIKYSDNSRPLTLGDLKTYNQKDVNIFKDHGPIKNSSETQNSREVYEFNEEVEKCVPSESIEELSKIYESISKCIKIASKIFSYKNYDDSKILMNDEALSNFKNFNEHIRKIREYIKNVETLSVFSENFKEINLEVPLEENNVYIEMVKEVIREISRINSI